MPGPAPADTASHDGEGGLGKSTAAAEEGAEEPSGILTPTGFWPQKKWEQVVVTQEKRASICCIGEPGADAYRT